MVAIISIATISGTFFGSCSTYLPNLDQLRDRMAEILKLQLMVRNILQDGA